MAITLANCRTILDSVLQRSGTAGDYTNTMRDVDIKTALSWANLDGMILRGTTDLTIKKNDASVSFSGVTNFASYQFESAHITDNKTNIRTSSYSWNRSGSGDSEYYLRNSAGEDPGLREPDVILEASKTVLAKAALGSLTVRTWNWGNNDSGSIDYDTVYVRLSSGGPDPDSTPSGNVKAMYFDDPVSLRGMNSIREMYSNDGSTADRPKYVGFDTTQAAMVYPPSDDLYVMRVRYRSDVTDWDMGTGSTVTVEVPEEQMFPIIAFGAAAVMMGGAPSVYTQTGMWREFKDWVRKIKGQGVDPGPTYKVPSD